MKISVHFTLFIALLVCGFNSAHGLDATLLDDTCKSSAVADPYEIGARLSESTYSHAGKCVDADLFRPAKIIKETGESIVFSNYFHDGEYYTFELKKSHPIEHLFYQILRFDVIQGITAGHVQFRVKFKTPVVIVSQTDTSKKVEVNDIIVSFEAARPKGVKYNFALGTMDSYVLVGRIMSGQAKLKEEYASTQQYEIKLPNKTDSMDLLITAIKQSDKDQYKRYYDTLWPNCATQIFDLMDSLPSMATKKMERFLTVLSNDPVAGPALQGLEKRGVL
ncbi:MAG: DUF4105 domain-containing protein, partial [Halobacteriovoraceae bacterium]|nr:DUF4105 domain-containing protein [Halobacteriovoraceae bacterium]